MAVLGAVSASCGGDDSGGGSSTESTSESSAVDRDAEFTFAIHFGFTALDPHRTASVLGDRIWLSPVYDSLLKTVKDADGVPVPGPMLATSYEVGDDGLSISFVLRDDVMFQDGTPFNAEAVQANIARVQDAESSVSSQVASIVSVEVVDDTHVVFHLSQPDPSIPWTMATGTAGLMVSPAAMGTDLAATPVGSGPFKLVSAQKDGDVVYERWDDYWDPDAALVNKLTLTTVTDPNARYNGLRSGTFDAAYVGPPQDLEAQELEADGYHYLLTSENPLGVFLNGNLPPFDDVDVRRAVSMAIDRQAISEAVLEGLGQPAYQVFNPGYLGHDDALDVDPYDPDEARRLVQEAGAEGASVKLLQVTGFPPLDAVAEVVQQSLNDIGLDVELAPVSLTENRTAWRSGAYEAFVGGLVVTAEPSQTLALNFTGGDNLAPPPADLVTMADAALVMPAGSDERQQAYQDISGYLVDNPIHVPVGNLWSVVVSEPDVTGSDQLITLSFTDLDFRGIGKTTS
ncbi:MAG: ABC transporter substrate-binding protein [Candidatus Limnocylindria bacterium]